MGLGSRVCGSTGVVGRGLKVESCGCGFEDVKGDLKITCD